MKVISTSFVLKGKTDYKDLVPVFPQMLCTLLEEIGQMPEDDDILQMYIELNLMDLRENRKPEGYNRKGKVRLVFPLDFKGFYLKTYDKYNDLKKLVGEYRAILDENGISYEIIEQNSSK